MTVSIPWRVLAGAVPRRTRPLIAVPGGQSENLWQCFLIWSLPEAIIAAEGGGLMKSSERLGCVASPLDLSKTIA